MTTRWTARSSTTILRTFVATGPFDGRVACCPQTRSELMKTGRRRVREGSGGRHKKMNGQWPSLPSTETRRFVRPPLFPVCHLFSFFIELLQWRGITGGYWRLKEWERNRPTSERVGRPKTTSGVQVPMSAGWQSIKIKTGQSNQPPSHTNVLLITYRRSGPFLYLFFPQFTSRRLILSIAAARALFTNI